MGAEHIRQIVLSVEAVKNRLDYFIQTITHHSRATLGRINDALLLIKQLLLKDVSAVEDMVKSYKKAYDCFLGVKIDHLLYFLDSAEDNVDYLLLRMRHEPLYLSLYERDHEYRGIMDYGWNAVTQAMGVFDVIRLSLISLEDINTMAVVSDLNETVRKALPFSLWSSNRRWRACEQLLKREGKAYRVQVKMLYSWVLLTWKKGQTRWHSMHHRLIDKLKMRKKHASSVKLCANEYKYTLNKALYDLSVIKLAAEDIVAKGTYTNIQQFKSSIEDHLKAISALGLWSYQHIDRYYAYNISKLELAKSLWNAKSKMDVFRYMEAVLFKTDLDAILKLKTEAQSMKSNIQKWYVASLAAVSSMIGYFRKDGVELNIRNLNIWRKPVIDLRTPEVLKYSYNIVETWRAWPASVPLQNLITPGGSQYISDILEGYMVGINEALYEVQHTSLTAKEEAVAAFDSLWDMLQSYKQQSQIDDNFIR